MTEKERSAEKFRARVAAEQEKGLAWALRDQESRERMARLVYDHDRDFDYETPDDRP